MIMHAFLKGNIRFFSYINKIKADRTIQLSPSSLNELLQIDFLPRIPLKMCAWLSYVLIQCRPTSQKKRKRVQGMWKQNQKRKKNIRKTFVDFSVLNVLIFIVWHFHSMMISIYSLCFSSFNSFLFILKSPIYYLVYGLPWESKQISSFPALNF